MAVPAVHITARREHERGDFTRVVHKGIWGIACDSQGCFLLFINIIENRSLRVCLQRRLRRGFEQIYLITSIFLSLYSSFFPDMVILYRAQIARYTRPHLRILAAFRTGKVLARKIAVLAANREGRCDGDIWHFILCKDFLIRFLHTSISSIFFAEVQMLYRAACVERLQFILQFHHLENVVRIADRQLRRICVVRRIYARGDDIWIPLFINRRHAVGRTLRRRSL